MRNVSVIILIVVSLLISLALAYYGGVFSPLPYQELMKELSDAFFVPALIFIGLGLLIRVADSGFFDMLTYGVKSLIRLFTPFDKKVGAGGYYEYKIEMEEKRAKRKPAVAIFLVGAADLLISLVFFALYYA